MTAQMVHDVLVFERKKMKRISGGRTRTRTLDPLIKSQLLYQLSYAPELLRRGSAERAWLSKGGRQCPAARFIQAPRRVKEKAAGLSGGFWMAIRVGEIASSATRLTRLIAAARRALACRAGRDGANHRSRGGRGSRRLLGPRAARVRQSDASGCHRGSCRAGRPRRRVS